MNPEKKAWGELSVLDPVGLAFERMKQVLFSPFDLSRWLAIGFCAWLAMLGQSGGGSGGGSYTGGGSGGGGRDFDVERELERGWDWVVENAYWLVPVVVGVMVVGLIFWVLLTWLSSRGQFMFLHCVVTNRAEVREPWVRYGESGRSLFWFRLALGLASFFIVVPLVVGAGVLVLWMFQGGVGAGMVLGVAALVLGAVVLGVGFAVVKKLTLDFVVPLMVLRGVGVRRAWGELLGVLRERKGAFVLYLLFQVVLAIGVGALVFAAVLLTCCVAGCLLAIPFVGTVLMLPVLVFDRAYSLIFLAQLGADYRLMGGDEKIV
ncbi:MAG: hypothetical protein RI897_1546 [Verrucomicrobiota bacterium]